MIPNPTSKRVHYLLTLAFLVAVFGLVERVELLVFAAPFAVALAAGLSRGGSPRVEILRSISVHTCFEDERIEYRVQLRSDTSVSMLELLEPLPSDVRIVSGSNHILTSLEAGVPREFSCEFTVPTRRSFSLTGARVRVFDAIGFSTCELVEGEELPVVVFPSPVPLRSLVRPVHTQVYTGNFPSQISGEGVEFSSIREMQPGDRLSSVNWRVTARREKLHVNQFVVERNADVVLFLDTFADVETGPASTLDLATRCAAAVAHHYIRGKNRVGLVEFGYYLSFVPPSSGGRQWYRLLAQLARSKAMARSVTYDVSTVPRQILSSRSLIIACTSLLSDRFDVALFDLKRRGYDVSVVYIEAEHASDAKPQSVDVSIASLAMTLWRSELVERINGLLHAGIPVVTWTEGGSLDAVLREINAVRARHR